MAALRPRARACRCARSTPATCAPSASSRSRPRRRATSRRNAITVAESAYEPNAWLRAIYAGDEPVGLLGLVADTETPDYWLARLMIAGQHQGRGYGRDAMALLVEHVRALPGARELQTSCVPADDGPLEFYLGLGFEQTGDVRERELVLRLSL